MTQKKVVLVEDDSMLLKYLSAALAEVKGIQVYTALDGAAGENMIFEQVPDLVLLDIIMPKKNGFEVLEAVRKKFDDKKMAVIMLSNLGQQGDIDQAKKLGATDYYVKVDMEVSDIVEKVKKFLGLP
ncbi:response regulator [Candidatus Uhrbacteria bacterium]|nr:response regulator [Candidatus Uhrbacteria bacterium]